MRQVGHAGALLVLVLASAASGATPLAPLPGKAEVEAALNAHEACDGAGNQACVPPLHYRLTRTRCYDLEDPYQPGRILCRYAGVLSGREQAPLRFDGDCAYLQRDPAGRWRIDAYPDADMCEE